jgi:hypothetical protein
MRDVKCESQVKAKEIRCAGILYKIGAYSIHWFTAAESGVLESISYEN